MTTPCRTPDLAKLVAKNYPVDSRLTAALADWQSQMPDGLFRSAVRPGEEGVAAFRQSVETFNMADPRHQQLAPAIFKNIGAEAMGTTLARQSQVLCLKNRMGNRSLLEELEQHLKLFSEAGIPVLCIKGAALLHTCYPDISVRRIMDIDIVVPEQRFAQAIDLLSHRRWVHLETGKPLESTLDRRFVHGINVSHPNFYFPLDIHAHINHGALWEGVDELFWSRAVAHRVGAIPAMMLCPEDNFTQLVVHGIAENLNPPVRWVLDTLGILRSAKAFDWQVVAANAQRMDVVPQHYVAMTYLLSIEDLPGMRDAAARLESLSATADGLAYWSFRLERPNSVLEAILIHRIIFFSSAIRDPSEKPWTMITVYLKSWIRVESLVLATVLACWKVVKRMLRLTKGRVD